MRQPALSIAVSTLLIAFSCAASADWQYTKWGMTVDEVVEASGGKATKIDDSRRDSEMEKAMATAPFVAGDFVFEAGFMFGKRDLKLQTVKLKLKEGNGYSLYAALVNRYGKPDTKDKTEVTELAKWIVTGDNNNVIWFVIGGEVTSLQYTPIIGDSEKKL